MDAAQYQQMAALEDRHWWFVGRRKILMTMLDTFTLPAKAQILEVGCGTGGNLAMLARYGEVYAMEMSAEARAHAGAKGIARQIAPATLPGDVPFAEKRFDLICLFDVLEHIEEDGKTLEILRSLLKEDGVLFLTVPAFPFLWSAHDEAHHHKRRYTKDLLLQTLVHSGYNPSTVRYFNSWLFPAVALMRSLRKRSKGAAASSDLTLPPRWLNAVLTAVFASERHVIGRLSLPWGVSLMTMARKKETRNA